VSREPRPFVALGFASTHDALDAEQLLGDLGITVVPMPAPKSLGALCGIALRLEPADESRADAYLEAAGIVVGARSIIEDV
jgi:hypothetical protein